MMNQADIPLVALGFLLGIRHSLDVDHLAAVSTLVAGPRGNFRSAIVGMYWGLGHSISLMVMGGAIIWLDVRFSTEVAMGLEALVGLMLIYLGCRVFYTTLPDASDHHRNPLVDRSGRTSVIVGMVHGLAGSAGLTLLLLPSMPSSVMGLVYLGVFGVGSVLGMGLSTYLLSIPLGRLGTSESGVIHGTRGRALKTMTWLAGSVCLGIGILLLWENGASLLSS